MAVHDSATSALAALHAIAPAEVPPNCTRMFTGRFGFGAALGARPASPDEWFERQLSLAARCPGYSGVDGLTDAFPTLLLDPPRTRRWLIANIGNEWKPDAMYQLEAATLCLQVWSPAQLFESVVDAFSNILNVANLIDRVWCARASFDRDVVRAHALGSYTDMLLAAAKHPAMLIYLDNASSSKTCINENYGRELLELHTVTPEAGYTQDDVINSARLLTGRRVNFATTTYVYNLNERWTGPVSVLGFTDENQNARQGEAIGDRYLRYLARHPSTAMNIARRLCRRFVSDNPPAALVDAVAAAYLANDTQIVPMLRTVFRSTEFWASSFAKTRRPLENLVATLRATGARPGNSLAASGRLLGQLSAEVGQRPLAWLSPDGYPDTASSWLTAGTLTEQWRVHWTVMNAGYGGAIRLPARERLFGGVQPRTVSQALRAASRTLLGQSLSSMDEKALLTYLGESGGHSYSRSVLAAQFGDVAALMLHGPAHTLR